LAPKGPLQPGQPVLVDRTVRLGRANQPSQRHCAPVNVSRGVLSWIDAVQFSFEAQSVIAMRLMKIATGGQDGAAECTRMVLEKIDAGTAAHTAGALALAGGKSVEAATKLAMAPVKRRVRANHLRLLRG
jgi:ABC-type hemin transport system ATPase subunit